MKRLPKKCGISARFDVGAPTAGVPADQKTRCQMAAAGLRTLNRTDTTDASEEGRGVQLYGKKVLGLSQGFIVGDGVALLNQSGQFLFPAFGF